MRVDTMADAHATNILDETKCGFLRGGHRSTPQRNKGAQTFSITRRSQLTRNPTIQRRIADLNKGEIWTSDDFDEPLTPVTSPERKRVMGSHRGVAWVSEDFDEPLPDEFWLGSDE